MIDSMVPLLLNYLRAIIWAITMFFLLFYLGRLHRLRLAQHIQKDSSTFTDDFNFVHSCFTGHYPSFSFQVSEEHHKLKRVYIVCLIGLCAPPGVATGGNVGEVWILRFTLGFEYWTPKYWKLDLLVSGFQMATSNWSDVLMVSKKRHTLIYGCFGCNLSLIKQSEHTLTFQILDKCSIQIITFLMLVPAQDIFSSIISRLS